MTAGQTDLNVGTQVRIKNIKGEDKYLNNLTGTITHPFAFGESGKNWVGVFLDGGGKCNVKITEIQIL